MEKTCVLSSFPENFNVKFSSIRIFIIVCLITGINHSLIDCHWQQKTADDTEQTKFALHIL